MLYIPATRAEVARRYLTIREAYGLSDDHPTTSEQAAKAGLAEAIATYSDGLDFSLAEIFSVADAVSHHRDDVAGVNPAIYDLKSLSIAVGSPELALLVCKLNGGFSHYKAKWVDDGDGVSRPILVEFPESLFTDYLTEWKERV